MEKVKEVRIFFLLCRKKKVFGGCVGIFFMKNSSLALNEKKYTYI